MKNFLELKPKIWQEIYKSFDPLDKDKSILSIKNVLMNNSFSDTVASSLCIKLERFLRELGLNLNNNTDNSYYYSSTDDKAFLKFSDIYEIKNRLENENENDIRIKRLLVAFIIFARKNPHPSGWIRYDKEQIFYIAGLSKVSVRESETLTCKLHNKYGLNMQVVGSTQPIPCFHFDWLDNNLIKDDIDDINKKEENNSNFIIDIGPFSPSSIIKFIEELNK